MILHYIAVFFAGLFLTNCIPHLTASLRDEPFPTPFAKPPGEGLSSPLINFFWAAFNLCAGIALYIYSDISIGLNIETGVLLVAFLALGTHSSIHFGAVRAKR